MTGGDASCTKRKNSTFTAWDGYITGTNLELKENSYIKQAWRTVEFKEEQPDSILEISLTAKGKGQTLLTLVHSALSVNDNKYKQGWIDSYFNPMKEYFDKKNKK